REAGDQLAALCVTEGKTLDDWRPLDGMEQRDAGEVEGYIARLIETAELKDQRRGAISHYEKAIDLAPEESINYVRLAYLYRNETSADAAKQAENNKKADDLLNDLVERNPESFQAYLARWRYRRDFDLIARPAGRQQGAAQRRRRGRRPGPHARRGVHRGAAGLRREGAVPQEPRPGPQAPPARPRVAGAAARAVRPGPVPPAVAPGQPAVRRG